MNLSKILLICKLLITINCILFGQDFNKVYDHDFSETSGTAIVETDSCYVGFSLGGFNFFGNLSVVVAEYDKNDGHVICQSVLSDSTMSFSFKSHNEVIDEDGFLTYILFAGNPESLVFIRYNKVSKVITQDKVSLEGVLGWVNYLDDVKKIGEKYYIFITSRFDNPDNNNLLPGVVIMNKDFTFKYQFYGDFGSNEYVLGSKATVIEDSLLILGLAEYDLRRKFDLPSSVFFVKINQKGDIIWKGKNLFPSEKILLDGGNICAYNDSTLFISALKYNIMTGEIPDIFYTKIMLMYDIKNDKIINRIIFPKFSWFESPLPHSIVRKTKDNNIVFGGGFSWVKGINGGEDQLLGTLGKMDKYGNILFYKSYSHFNADSLDDHTTSRISDIEESPDGDLICIGGTQYHRSYTWLLKTDRDGNIKESVVNNAIDHPRTFKNSLLVFPIRFVIF
ncbi:MAG: hypothetical protein IPN29_15010 [Saprospiraceae bacterium]|nr:hypothetical protein [Saprospiraceae bacterium]